MEQPVGDERKLVVVVRVAQAEEAQEVFIHKIKVEEAVDVSDGGVVADGVSLVRIGEAAEDVPGRGDEQEEQESRDGLEVAPATPLAGEQQVRDGRAEEKDGRNQSFGKQSKGYGGPHPVDASGAAGFESGDETVESH